MYLDMNGWHKSDTGDRHTMARLLLLIWRLMRL